MPYNIFKDSFPLFQLLSKVELAHLKVLQSFHQLLEDVEEELGRDGRAGTWLGGGLAPRCQS